MKSLITTLAAGAALFLTGCVMPLAQLPATPAVGGRVVDASTRQPITRAEVRFVQIDNVTPFDTRVGTTDAAGQFYLPASQHWGGGVIWNPKAGGGVSWGDYSHSILILVHGAGYQDQVIDLEQAYVRLGHKFQFNNDVLFFNEKDLTLGDITLVKREKNGE